LACGDDGFVGNGFLNIRIGRPRQAKTDRPFRTGEILGLNRCQPSYKLRGSFESMFGNLLTYKPIAGNFPFYFSLSESSINCCIRSNKHLDSGRNRMTSHNESRQLSPTRRGISTDAVNYFNTTSSLFVSHPAGV
jgi:hypothetical protein